jgi:hypothetical protein
MRSATAVCVIALGLSVHLVWAAPKLRGAPFGGELALNPVASLNATQYLGRWYQMYQDFVSNATYEAGACGGDLTWRRGD